MPKTLVSILSQFNPVNVELTLWRRRLKIDPGDHGKTWHSYPYLGIALRLVVTGNGGRVTKTDFDLV